MSEAREERRDFVKDSVKGFGKGSVKELESMGED